MALKQLEGSVSAPDHVLSSKSLEHPQTCLDVDNLAETQRFSEIPSSAEFMPKLTKPGYFTSPPMNQLQRMSINQLRQVENFCIFNVFGKVEFEKLTDVTFQDLDLAVEIRHGYIEVYPDEIGQQYHLTKPPVGSKLNKPAKLYYYRMNLPSFSNLSKKVSKLGASLSDYLPVTRTMAIKVEHFTKFEFKEEDDEKPVQPPQDLRDTSVMRSFSLPLNNRMDIEHNPLNQEYFGQPILIIQNPVFPRPTSILNRSTEAPRVLISNNQETVGVQPSQSSLPRPEHNTAIGLSTETNSDSIQQGSSLHYLDREFDIISKELKEFNMSMLKEDFDKDDRIQLHSSEMALLDSACSALSE